MYIVPFQVPMHWSGKHGVDWAFAVSIEQSPINKHKKSTIGFIG
jgi:hypothetical protein